MANPTPDRAIDECLDALGRGAAGRRIDPAGLEALREQYLPRFQRNFEADPDAWKAGGAHVLRMAWYVGVFAGFFAETAGSKTVSEEHLARATAIVGRECSALMAMLAARRRRAKEFPSLLLQYCPP